MSGLQLILGFLNLLRNLFNKAAQNVGLAGKLIQLGGLQAALLQNPLQTRQLLGHVIIILAQLVEYFDIVLGVLVLRTLLQTLGLLLSLCGRIRQNRLACCELVDNDVQGFDQTRGGGQTATNSTVSASLLIQEVNKVFLGAATTVSLSLLATSREELDGRV